MLDMESGPKIEQDQIELLQRSCALFSLLSREDVKAITALSRRVQFEAGETIFNEGDSAVGFFIVLSGLVKVYKLSEKGDEQILHFVKLGESFAEAAIFSGTTFPASASCLRDSQLLFLPKDEFVELLKERSDVALRMLGSLSLWLRRLVSTVEALSLKDSKERLIASLCGLPPQHSEIAGFDFQVQLPMKKNQLAMNLGIANESLSRIFRSLQDKGLIKVQGRTIHYKEKLFEK